MTATRQIEEPLEVGQPVVVPDDTPDQRFDAINGLAPLPQYLAVIWRMAGSAA